MTRLLVQQITDLPSLPEEALFDRLRGAARLGLSEGACLSVQLRDPGLPVRELVRMGSALRALTREMGATLVVNDRVDLALLVEADGVHLGRRSMSVADARSLLGAGAWISTSAHAVEDVIAAARAGANAALLSPIFSSPGKGAPLGTAALRRAREALAREGLALHLLALGGVTLENVAACLAAGADGVAAIRADLTPLLRPGHA